MCFDLGTTIHRNEVGVVYFYIHHKTLVVRNKINLDQLPWFAIFKLYRFIPSQRGDLVKIQLIYTFVLHSICHIGTM